MNPGLLIPNALFSFGTAPAAAELFNLHPWFTLATMNRVEIIVHTAVNREVYRIEEQDDMVLIYKRHQSFFGFAYFKKLAQARSRESALKIIHILTGGAITHWEVSPLDYFEGGSF